MSRTSSKNHVDISLQDFEALVAAANSGDGHALTELRKTLEQNPQVWQQLGDIAEYAESALVALIANGNAAVAQSIRLKIAQTRENFGYRTAPELERALIRRISLAIVESEYLATLHPLADDANSYRVAAEQRMDAAIRSLATVRKLLGAQSQQRFRVCG